uniref:GRIP domain-containing protein n=1 Tax=Strongyloides venezuelensis TaxID=75913 RepID=A0A0K0FGP9_STRVS
MDSEALMSMDTDKEKEIADLQHQLLAFEQQCARIEKDYDVLKGENLKLKKANEELENDALERIKFLRNLEGERDDLSLKVHQIENENSILRGKIEVFECQVVNVTEAKEKFQEKIESLTSDINELKEVNEKLRSNLEKNADEARRNRLERESWNDQKMLYENSKNWYLKEIRDRDESLGSKSITISKLELQLQEVQASVNEREENLQQEIKELKIQLKDKDENIESLMKECQENHNERLKLATSHDSIIASREKITEALKEALEEEQKKSDELAAQVQGIEEELNESKTSLINATKELDRVKSEYLEDIRCKDEMISDMKKEIVRLSSSGTGSGNWYSQNLPEINGDTTGTLKQSKTLSSLILMHSHVAAERDNLKDKLAFMEDKMNEFAESMGENVRVLESQLIDYKETLLDNKSLRAQIGNVQEMLEETVETKDKLQRELNYTKTQLMRYQVDSQELSKQVKRLLYMVESERKGFDASKPEDCEGLFSDIDSLQKVNSELRSRLLLLEANKEEDIRKARETEAEKLSAQLVKAEEDLKIVQEQMKVQTEMLKKVQEQRDHFAETIETYNKMGLSADAQNLRISLDELKNEKTRLEAKIVHLEDLTASFNEQKNESDQIYKNRIDEQSKLIIELRGTVGKLESDVQYLRQLNRTTAQKCEAMERLSDRTTNKMNNLIKENEKKIEEIGSLNKKLIEYQEEISHLKVDKRCLEDQNRILTSSEARLQTENETLRGFSTRANKVESAVDEIQDFIKKMTEDSMFNSQAQLEALIKQRDSINETFKTTMEQNSRNITDLKATIVKLEGDRKAAEDKVKLIENSLKEKEAEIVTLKDKVLVAENQLGQFNDGSITTEDYKGEVRKMGTAKAYLERRCTELEELVNNYKLRLKVKDEQLNKISEFSEDVESELKKANDIGNSEISRLQEQLTLCERELEIVKKNLEDSRATIGSLETECSQKAIDLSNMSIKMNCIISEGESNTQNLNNLLETSLRDANNLREEIDSLTQLKESLNETIGVLEAQVAALEKTVDEKENALKKSEYALSQQIIVFNSLKEEYESYKNIMDTERERLQNKIDEMVSAEKVKVENNDHMLNELRGLINSFTEMKEKSALSRSMNTSMSMSMLSSGDDDDSSEKYIETIARLNRMIECLQNDCQATLQRCAQAECELTNVRSLLAVEKTNTSMLDTKVNELRHTIEVQLQELKDKNLLVQKMKVLDITKEELERVKVELQEVLQKCTELEKTLKEKDNANLALESKNVILENDKENLAKDLTSVTKERDSWKKQNEKNLEVLAKYGPSKCEMLVTEIETAKSVIAKLQEENKKFVEEQANKSADNAEEEDYKNKFIRVRKLARDYRDQAQLLKEKSERLENMLKEAGGGTKDTEAEATIAELQNQINEKNIEIDNLKKEIDVLNEKVEDLTLELDRNSLIENLAQQYSSDLKVKEHEIVELKEQVKELKSRIETLLNPSGKDDEIVEESQGTEELTNDDDADDLGAVTPPDDNTSRKRGLSQELDLHDDLVEDIYDSHKKSKFDDNIDILQTTEDILEDPSV